jgi:hypothetical protein
VSGRGLACTCVHAPVHAVKVAEHAEDLTVLLDRLELRRVLTGYPNVHAQMSTEYIGVRAGYLQAGLQDFDEAADLVGDLGARCAELGRADDLRTNWASV